MPDNDAVEGARHGFLVLDKAAGDSSARAIDPVKKRFGKRTKVGHAGTLDPVATGVLIVLVGDATRLSDLAMALPKTYEATVAFGSALATAKAEPGGTIRSLDGAAT